VIPRSELKTEDLVSHYVRNSRGNSVLLPVDEILQIAKILDPRDVDIRKLSEITTKSSVLGLIAEVRFDKEWKGPYAEQYHEFQFGDKIWLVTKIIQNTVLSSLKYPIFGNLALNPKLTTYSPHLTQGTKSSPSNYRLVGLCAPPRTVPEETS